MAGKKLVRRIKESLSLGSRSPSPLPGPSTAPTSLTPFTSHVLANLDDEESKLVAMTFAPQIETDCDARKLDFDEYYHLLGHKTKGNAMRTLLKTIQESELVFIKSDKNSVGRPRDICLVSVNQIEEALLAANTEEGKRWRKLVLKIKNSVVHYMKMEMDMSSRIAQRQLEDQRAQAQQQLEVHMSKLALEEAKRAQLEAVQCKLQATIDSQKRREEKKEARKKQQKEPLETAYIMTNMPDDNQGPYKCGKTGGDPKKRAKEMQTGNHEEMRVVASAKCVDSKLVEDVMHRIFWDYRTSDKLEWFDTSLHSMSSVLHFVVEIIDGLNRVDHDESSVSEPLEQITASMRELVLNSPPHGHEVPQPVPIVEQVVETPPGNSHLVKRWLVHMIEHELPVEAVTGTAMLALYNTWLRNFHPGSSFVVSNNYLKPRLQSYFKRGVNYSSQTGKPAFYTFDRSAFTQTLIDRNMLSCPVL